MTSGRRTLVGAVGALALLVATGAHALGLGAVGVTGECPNDELVQSALARRSLPGAARDYSLVVRAVEGGARVSLADAQGTSVVERELASGDCSALADAASLIVEAYFVELAARDAGPPAASSLGVSAGTARTVAPAAAASEPVTAPSTPTSPTSPTPPPSASAPSATPAPSAPAAVPAAAAAPPARAPGASVASPSTLRATWSLGAGADWLPADNAWSAAFQASAGAAWPRSRWELELHAVAGTSTLLGDAPDRVRRSETRVAARVARGFGAEPVVLPWAGLGVAMARLRLEDLAGASTHVRWSPILEAGGSVAVPVARAWSLGAELGCRVLLVREEYRVDPDGRIGEGPRIGCTLLGRVSWGSGSVP